VQVTPVTSLGPAACSVSVGPDGTWSLVVKPGVYDVFGLSPASNDTRAACTPEGTTRSGCAGDHVFVRIAAFHEVTWADIIDMLTMNPGAGKGRSSAW
jgi:hypothetical protein